MPASFRFICELPTGLHARPASLLAETVRRFRALARVVNEKTGAAAEAKSVLSVIGLDIARGTPVLVEAEGEDAAGLIEAVKTLVASHFGEAIGHCMRAGDGEGAFIVRVPAPLRRLGLEVVGGTPVFAGVGEGTVVVASGLHMPEAAARGKGTDAGAERARFEGALAEVRREIESDLGRAKGLAAGLLRAHLGIVDDPALRARVEEFIDGGDAAACAVVRAARKFVEKLGASSSRVIRERASDIEDVCRRVVGKIDPGLLAEAGVVLDGESVVVAESMGVSQLMAMDQRLLRGLVLEEGGTTSHVVILARSLGIPTLVGVDGAVAHLRDVGGAGRVVVDAIGGFVMRADERVRGYYEREARAGERRRERVAPLLRRRGRTADGVEMEVGANAGSVAEIGAAMEEGADGIGLLRTEMLFLDRATEPSEEEQYGLYRGAVEAVTAPRAGTTLAQSGQGGGTGGGTGGVIIRTLDIGGDKPAPYLELAAEDNPFLGVRGVRLYERYPDLLRAQLRAICRASAHGTVKVMAPMVATVGEARWFCERIAKAQAELSEEGVAYDADMEVGIMVEVPSVCAIVDQLAKVVDFISIGTNDLCQYWCAADRTNAGVAALNDARQPSFLRVLEKVCTTAREHGVWVGVCGEMAGDVRNLALMVGLGVDEISVAGPVVGKIKEMLSGMDSAECRGVLERAMGCESVLEVEEVLRERGVGRTTLAQSGQGGGTIERELVVVGCECASREEVIQELVGLLHAAGRTDSAREVEEAVWAREEKALTALVPGFAIPHCQSDAVACPSICVAQMRTPIAWGTAEQPVRVVIMLTVPASDAEKTHLKLLAKLARKLVHEEFREALMGAGSADDVLSVLQTGLEL